MPATSPSASAAAPACSTVVARSGRKRRAVAQPAEARAVDAHATAPRFAAPAQSGAPANAGRPRPRPAAAASAQQRAVRGVRRRSSGDQRMHEQQRIDREIPGDHAPQRRRQQVDALAAADASAADAECERDQRDHADPLHAPQPLRMPLRQRRFARREPLQRMARALGDERGRAAPGATAVVERDAARPRRGRLALQCGLAGARGLERLEQRDRRAAALVHRVGRTRLARARIRPAPGRSGSSARRWCLRRSGRRARRGRCARPGSR